MRMIACVRGVATPAKSRKLPRIDGYQDIRCAHVMS